MFQEAEAQFEEIKDLFIELEDAKTFSYGYNYCAYYPSEQVFIISKTLTDKFSDVNYMFTDKVKRDILHGEAVFSFLIGVAVGDDEGLKIDYFESFESDTVEGDSEQGFGRYSQIHLSNYVKLCQVVKQVDLRLKKEDWDLRMQFDNFGCTLLIGKRKSK